MVALSDMDFELSTFFPIRLSLVTYQIINKRHWGWQQGWQLIGMYVVNISARPHAKKISLGNLSGNRPHQYKSSFNDCALKLNAILGFC